MKRHNFKGQGASHGNHKHHRSPGSVGACATPARVFKGTRMAGQMGGEQVTTLNLEVVQADAERKLSCVKGAVPGPRGGMVVLRDAVKAGVKGGARVSADTIDFETASPAEIRRFLRPAPARRTVTRRSDRRRRPRRGRPRPETFGIEPNLAVLHQVVTAQLAAARAGHPEHQDPGRGLRRRRQAVPAEGHRPGPRRLQPAPIWVGGGVALGPKPRSYAQKTPKKMIRWPCARRCRTGPPRARWPWSTRGRARRRAPRPPWPRSAPWSSRAGPGGADRGRRVADRVRQPPRGPDPAGQRAQRLRHPLQRLDRVHRRDPARDRVLRPSRST